MSGPILDANDPDFFSDRNFASFDAHEGAQIEQVDADGNTFVSVPITAARFADYSPGPFEDGSNLRGRPDGDTSVLRFGDDVL